jgi:hypothetical protein
VQHIYNILFLSPKVTPIMCLLSLSKRGGLIK